MPKKKLSDEEKYNAVMDLPEGRGRTSEICTRHGIRLPDIHRDCFDSAAAKRP